MSCPFYAHSLFPHDWILIENHRSNQCALITDAHSPCILEFTFHRPADWATCPRNPSTPKLVEITLEQ